MKKFILLLFALSLFAFIPQVSAQSESDLQQQIADLQSKISDLKNQALTLSGQIAYYDAQIALTNLKISQSQQTIGSLSQKIVLLEDGIQKRSLVLQHQITQTYKQGEVSPLQTLLSSANFSILQQRFKYIQAAQATNRELLHQSQITQSTLSDQRLKEESARKNNETQKIALTQLQSEKASLLTQTQNNESKYQALLVQAQANLASLRRFVTSQGGASILTNQTVCTDWGCYYNQRDAQWGLLALGTSNSSVAEFGCLVSSTAMVATHYKKNLTPADIASEPTAFFRDLLWQSITVKGVSIVRTNVSPTLGNIDSELSAGRPVIVGLYSGPDHFIVLKSGSAGHYIMNDPFMPDGHDVNFTDKYSLNNISNVEHISVN